MVVKMVVMFATFEDGRRCTFADIRLAKVTQFDEAAIAADPTSLV